MAKAGKCDGCGEFSYYLTVVVADVEPYGPPANYCQECIDDDPHAVPADDINKGVMDPDNWP